MDRAAAQRPCALHLPELLNEFQLLLNSSWKEHLPACGLEQLLSAGRPMLLWPSAACVCVLRVWLTLRCMWQLKETKDLKEKRIRLILLGRMLEVKDPPPTTHSSWQPFLPPQGLSFPPHFRMQCISTLAKAFPHIIASCS